MQHFLSSASFNRALIEELLASAKRFSEGSALNNRALNRVIGLWFLDASTRTRVGFEVASLRLGAKPFHISQKKFTQRMSVEESFEDTLRVLSDYADLLCIRGAEDFTKRLSTASCPVLNCGNGDDEHPSQAITDLFTIQELKGQIEGLCICIVGDLRHMRAAHSLARSLGAFPNIQIDLVSPSLLRMPEQYLGSHDRSLIVQTDDFSQVIAQADVIYFAGFAPNTPVGVFDEATRSMYRLDTVIARKIKKDAIILCPLPRIDEILPVLDAMTQSAYFVQSKMGLFARMAILNRYISQI